MAQIEKTVFISYRRKDISWALAVYQYLTSQKYDVFFDFSSLSSGDFEEVIVSNIRARAHFVLILTPTALDRCNEPGDWLRREIETAIDEKRNIIPLFFDGFNFSSPSVIEKLTGKLSAIQRYNGLDIPSGYFLEAMERLRSRYLNVPLYSVIHPVSTEVRKVIKEEQNAANNAIQQKWEEIKEILTPVAEKTSTRPVVVGSGRSFNLRTYGIGAGILLIVALVGLGIRSMIPGKSGRETPTATFPATLISTSAMTNVALTQTRDVSTITATPNAPTPTPTATLSLGVGSTMSALKDGMTLLYVPDGEFIMGFEGQEIDEKPVHSVSLAAYWIDQTEVTNGMYALCVSDGKCLRPSSFSSRKNTSYYGNSEFNDYPVIFVSWENARSYCEWAGRRLPTEAEWEKAARGKDQRTYPWGEQIGCSYLNYYDVNGYCVGDTAPVGSYKSVVSTYVLHDMAGNVWEWVADWYEERYYRSLSSPSINPIGPASGGYRVARGGSWDDFEFLVRAANRGSFAPESKTNNIGFRCVMDASE